MVNIFLLISFNIKTVLVSTHNVCFGREIRKKNNCYPFLLKARMNTANLDLHCKEMVQNFQKVMSYAAQCSYKGEH